MISRNVSMRWAFQWHLHNQKRLQHDQHQSKINTQKQRNIKEYRRLLKKQDIDQNIKLAMDKLRKPSNKVFIFNEEEYAGTTDPENVKDTSLPLPSKYSPKFVEAHWYNWWERQGFFSPEKMKQKRKTSVRNPNTFSMVIPPPNVTGKLHIGHALTVALEDTLVRWQSMLGNEVLWLPGSDHAGIATQVMVEKHIEKEYGEIRQELGPEKFREAVWEWKQSKGTDIHQQLRRLGASLDWDRSIFTLDDKYVHAVEEAFIRLFNEGLIYRDKKCINWCCHLQSTLSDLEVESKEINQPTILNLPGYPNHVQFGVLHRFAYKLANPVGDISEVVVATTRLETIVGDEAVAVHPDDPRYASIIGQRLVHPIRFDKQIPIIADTAVDMEYGTGAMKVTPAHDFTDFEIGQRHGLPVESTIDSSGRINYKKPLLPPRVKVSKFDYLIGLKRFIARDTLMAQLRTMNLYRGSQPQKSVLRMCSRSGDVVEPMVKEQWFVDVAAMAKEALEVVESDKINLVQKSQFEKQWRNWLTTTGDWCISRQIWWGHKIPAFHVKDEKTSEKAWVPARNESEALEEAKLKFPKSKASDLVVEQDEDVLDTWFSSALYPFASLGWPKETEDMKKYFPLTLMETGSDLIFFWVARMTMLGMKLTGQIPFRNIMFHPLIRDKYNRKMSKSVGNVVDPLQVIDGSTMHDRVETLKDYDLNTKDTESVVREFYSEMAGEIPRCGADALRLSLMGHSAEAQSIKYEAEQAVQARKFCNKVWNIFRFLQQYALNDPVQLKQALEKVDQSRMDTVDLWMRSRLAHAVSDCNNALSNHRIPEALKSVKELWQHDISSVYWRHSHGQLMALKSEDDSTTVENASIFGDPYMMTVIWNMMDVVETALRLLAPFAPFLCEELWQRIPGNILSENRPESIFLSPYPTSDQHDKDKNLKVDQDLDFLLRLADHIREDKISYLLSNDFGVVFVCKDQQQIDVLSSLHTLIQSLVFCKTNEVFPFEKLEELKEECLGSFDEKDDVIILFRLSPDAFRAFVDDEHKMRTLDRAKEVWVKKVEHLEKSIDVPEKRETVCDKIIQESKKYLKLKKFKESIERVKEHMKEP